MTVHIIFCDKEVINNDKNKQIIFKQLEELSVPDPMLTIPYGGGDQSISSSLEDFAKECDAQRAKKGRIKRMYLSKKPDTFEYLHKGMYTIAHNFPEELIEVHLYSNQPLDEILKYFAKVSFPGTIKLIIHPVENNEILSEPRLIQGQGFINEDTYFAHNSPVGPQLNLIRELLCNSEDSFLRGALLKLGAVLLEKANTQNQEIVSAFGAQVYGILYRYHLLQQSECSQPLINQAIQPVVMQALVLMASFSSQSKTSAFFSQHKYFSSEDLKFTTTLMQNIIFTLDQPDTTNIKIMVQDLERLNNTNNAQYLVAAGIILAGVLLMTGPVAGLVGLGLMGVFMATPMLVTLLAVAIATVVTPIMSMLTMTAGANAILMQKHDAEVKTKLSGAITGLETAISSVISMTQADQDKTQQPVLEASIK